PLPRRGAHPRLRRPRARAARAAGRLGQRRPARGHAGELPHGRARVATTAVVAVGRRLDARAGARLAELRRLGRGAADEARRSVRAQRRPRRGGVSRRQERIRACALHLPVPRAGRRARGPCYRIRTMKVADAYACAVSPRVSPYATITVPRLSARETTTTE